MPIKSKVLIQTLQKFQDRHKIRFSFGLNNKNTKKSLRNCVFLDGADLPLPNTIKLDFRKSQEAVFIAPRTRGKHNRLKNRNLERC